MEKRNPPVDRPIKGDDVELKRQLIAAVKDLQERVLVLEKQQGETNRRTA